tara:strand:- start:1304 stop:1564 length:261 start_codon:yes stop_codon:yes gene_type:complete
MKRVLSLIGIGTLALLVAHPANAKLINKNEAFNMCKKEVRSQYQARATLNKIRSRGQFYHIQFKVPGQQKVWCELDKSSGEMWLNI